MKRIVLRNAVVLVDDEDFPLVSRYRWHLRGGYASGRVRGADGPTVYLHRLLMNLTTGVEVDHINRNKLDNRRSNLRAVTPAENRQNKSLARNNHSGHRGISRDGNKWRATVRVGGVQKYNRRFESLDDAVVAVKAARAELLPCSNEFAMTTTS